MYSKVEKPKENKSRATANSVNQMNSNVKQRVGFVDNRYEAISPLLQNANRVSINKSDHNTTIQRSVGFETEYNVPTYGPAPGVVDPTVLANGPEGNAPTTAIHQALFNGLPYGQNRGQNQNFTLKPDHNNLQTVTDNLRKKLSAMGLLLKIPGDFRETSNLEYVTPARDELAVGSRTAFNELSNAIRLHAIAIDATNNARNNLTQIGAPANNTYTGVPLTDLQKWLGSRYGEAQVEIQAFRNAIVDEFYIQATVGIIPSSLRDMHKSYTPTKDTDVSTYLQLAMFMVNAGVDLIEKVAWFKNHDYINELRNGRPGGFLKRAKPPDMITYESLMGVMHVIYMYMVGSALNQTNILTSTRKNAVPFMSKMSNFRDIINLAAPSLHKNRPPDDLVELISNAFNILPPSTVDYWVKQEGVSKSESDERIALIDPTSFVKDVLESRSVNPQVPSRLNTAKERQFDNPDAMPQIVQDASGGEAGAQFEYRYITDSPTAAGLAAVFDRISEEVRVLNSKNVKGQALIDLLTQART